VAVIEVGLGGRLDSTNIISPDLSIITSIGFDHMKLLGDTLPKIAAEKAGIIKPETPVVIGEAGEKEIERVFIEKSAIGPCSPLFCRKGVIRFFRRTKRNRMAVSCRRLPPPGRRTRGDLAQEKNARTVLTAVRQLQQSGYHIPKEAVYKGFANVTTLTGLLGRWQQLQSSPRIICDIAHNAHGLRYVAEQLLAEHYDRLHMVFGMANDKDVDSVLAILPKKAHYYFTKASVERAMNENTLRAQAITYGLQGDCFVSVKDALNSAKENAGENDLIFIGGSSFVVADALPLFM